MLHFPDGYAIPKCWNSRKFLIGTRDQLIGNSILNHSAPFPPKSRGWWELVSPRQSMLMRGLMSR